MNYLRQVLGDRRRSQRGSVLSGVLIMVAFLSIIAGALMTELSTNFLVSHALVTRVGNEATVNSAMELALDGLQHTSLGSPCPALATVPLNGRNAAASYTNCAPALHYGSSPRLIADTSPFTIDGTHVLIPSLGLDEYLVGDVRGDLYAYPFGQPSRSWRVAAGGSLTGPPTAIVDFSSFPPGVLDMVPITGTNCGFTGSCVAVLGQSTISSPPQALCFMSANGPVTGRPAAGIRFPSLVYFGDAGGTMLVYIPGDENGCQQVTALGVGQAVVAGPLVFPGTASKQVTNDEIYVVTSDGSSSRLLHLTFSQGSKAAPNLTLDSALTLSAPNAVGIALEPGGNRLAVTFVGGQVDLAQTQTMTKVSRSVPTTIAGTPYWCQCPGGAGLIGVGGHSALYVLDTSLNVYGTYALSGPVINTAPAADSAGDWFFGADDGNVYEVQRPAVQSAMTLAEQFALGAQVGSSPIVGACPAGICVYVGMRDGNAYLLPLDSRDALMTACLTSAPDTCSGANPRLWAHVYVGAAGAPQTVRIVGWSYYSP